MSDRQDRPPLLTPGLRTFLAVDVILVLTFLALAVVQFAGRPPTAPDPAASSVAAPGADGTDSPVEENPEEEAPAAPESVVAVDRFVMPSGNIWCSMTETSASCTILQFSFAAPAPPSDCAGTMGNVVTVTAESGAFLPCVTAVAPVPEDTPVLEYGEASAIGQMTCYSSTNGATCEHNATGAGFSVARAGYRLS